MIDILNRLKPNPDNPRTITVKEFEQLKNNIRALPQMLETHKIVYDGDIILGGNQRLEAVKELVKEGFEVKDSYFADATNWTDEQKKRFLITDNVENGRWNWDKLANEWPTDKLREWGVDLPLSWEVLDNPDKEWVDMPEFKQEDLTAFKQIIISFASQKDIDDFAKLVNQPIHETTRSIWFPEAKREKWDKAFVDKE